MLYYVFDFVEVHIASHAITAIVHEVRTALYDVHSSSYLRLYCKQVYNVKQAILWDLSHSAHRMELVLNGVESSSNDGDNTIWKGKWTNLGRIIERHSSENCSTLSLIASENFIVTLFVRKSPLKCHISILWGFVDKKFTNRHWCGFSMGICGVIRLWFMFVGFMFILWLLLSKLFSFLFSLLCLFILFYQTDSYL